MTRVFENRLHDLSKSDRIVFVAGCDFGKRERALLVFPIGDAQGTIVLIDGGEIYNGAGVKIDSKGITLVDAGGGESSYQRVLEITTQLTRLRFAMMRPDDVIPLVRTESANTCHKPSSDQ